jgi:hypothetical protein
VPAPSQHWKQPPDVKKFIAYLDPSGGLNTKRDAHALDRNMAAASVNMWSAYDNALSKRPGTAAAITSTGATGMAGTGTHIVATRWQISGTTTTTFLLAQNGNRLAYAQVGSGAWTPISTPMGNNARRIHVAQMFDPKSGANQCFICNGVDVPWMWAGPGSSTLVAVTTGGNYLPSNAAGGYITPRFVTTVGNNSVLVYAGEPTSPSAVYISDAFKPQQFTQSATTSTAYPGSYQPYLIGWNDGVGGGAITGLATLQGNIIVYKESAIYRGQFAGIYSTVLGFQWQTVSAQRGMVAPESLAGFDTFDVFLSLDGVYFTDGYQVQQISANVPTYFDGSLNGYGALCLQYSTAVGVRSGHRYLIFYDRGLPSAPGAPAGYPTSGLWFDFSKPDVSSLPQAGEMTGVSSADGSCWAVCGMAKLAGPGDSGLVAWIDPTRDRVGIFGQGFSDFGQPIACTFAGKADMMAEVASPGPEAAPISTKRVHRGWVSIAAGLSATPAPLQFGISFVTDLLSSVQTVGYTPVVPSGGFIWGSGVWGNAVWGGGSNATDYTTVSVSPDQTAEGRIIQVQITESSMTEWILLGYVLEVSAREPVL